MDSLRRFDELLARRKVVQSEPEGQGGKAEHSRDVSALVGDPGRPKSKMRDNCEKHDLLLHFLKCFVKP